MFVDLGQCGSVGAQRRPVSPLFIQSLPAVLDPLMALVTGAICYVVYYFSRDTLVETQYFVAIIMGGIFSAGFFQWLDVYRREFFFSIRRPTQRLLAGWAGAFALLLFTAFALKISDSFSRIWAVSWFLSTAGALTIGRVSLYLWISSRVREGALAERSVILGAGERGLRFAAYLKSAEDPYTKLLGFIDDRTTRVPRFSDGYELLGNTQDLLEMIRANRVDQVFLALPWTASERLSELVKMLALTPVRVCLVTEPLKLEVLAPSVKIVGNHLSLRIIDHPLSGWSYVIKDLEDRLLSLLILICIAPLMCLIGLAIRLDSPGPVLFRQKRFGFNNQMIEVLKFRTMYVDQSDAGGMQQATKNDPRVTRFGRFLRKSSLDELPQFLNVLMGDMSIVGPRPHPIELTSKGHRLEELVDRYVARHRVKPGITGWAQINGFRGETESLEKMEKRIAYDLYYIDNWSIWFDLVIILKTLVVVFKGENAY